MHYTQSEIKFQINQIPFILENLNSIKEGSWPVNPHETLKVRRPSFSGAYYEACLDIALELERRMKNCGIDSQICKAYYIEQVDPEDLADYYETTSREILQICEAVIWYCSGEEWEYKPYDRDEAFRVLSKRA
jgi:hypothetical protein